MRRPGRIPEYPAAVTGLIEPAAVGQDEATFSEDLGWTGFAIPQLSQRYSVVATGFIVGLLWGVWHFPLFAGSVPSDFYLAVLLFRGCHPTGRSWRAHGVGLRPHEEPAGGDAYAPDDRLGFTEWVQDPPET
jgi:Type II CAAX prenyl endopeptidase Rce1-like